METKNGKVAAICEYCGRKSRRSHAAADGEPGILDLPAGWSIAPYPSGFSHGDGTCGSKYTCPACNKRLAGGNRLRARNGEFVLAVQEK